MKAALISALQGDGTKPAAMAWALGRIVDHFQFTEGGLYLSRKMRLSAWKVAGK